MNWKYITNSTALGISDISGGYAPRKKEWLPFALAGASLASSIFGGMKAADQQRKAERELQAEKDKNEAWYNRRYNESYADTAAGQNMIRMARDYARENWKKAQGAAAVGGGTDAATAMAKEQGNKMVGDTIASIAATDTARKDNVDAAYRAEKSRLSQQQMAIDQAKAQNISNVAGAAGDALMTGAMYFAGTGSPGGGGVEPAQKTSQLQKMGMLETPEMPAKLYQANENYSLAKKSALYNPELFWQK